MLINRFQGAVFWIYSINAEIFCGRHNAQHWLAHSFASDFGLITELGPNTLLDADTPQQMQQRMATEKNGSVFGSAVSLASFLILQAAGNFFSFLALFDRCALPSQISCPSRAPVAQLDRASDYGSEGWWFESSRARSLRRFYCPYAAPKK
jgi:hypothetical protein